MAGLIFLFVSSFILLRLRREHKLKGFDTSFYESLLVILVTFIFINLVGMAQIFYVFYALLPGSWRIIGQVCVGGLYTLLAFYMIYICVLGIRDERMIRQIDWCTEQARKHVEAHLLPLEPTKDYELLFRMYGKNGVLGEVEPVKETRSHELGVIVEAIAPREELAENVCELAGRKLLHMDYPGRIATAGNIAHPYSPTANNLGPVYTWNIWHLLDLEDPCEPFATEVRQFG